MSTTIHDRVQIIKNAQALDTSAGGGDTLIPSHGATHAKTASDPIPQAVDGIPVDLTGITDGQVPAYDAGTGTLVPSSVASGGATTLDALTDTDITTPSSGDVLAYNATTGKWIDSNPIVSDHGSLNGLSDDDHEQYLLANGSRELSADWDAGAHKITAETLESVVTGAAPLTVASNTLVDNLNADKLDGEEGSYYLNRTNHTGVQSANTVELNEIGSATFDDIQDWCDTTQSAGVISGFMISDGGSGTINISAGIGVVKTSNSNTGGNMFFDLGLSNGVSLTDNSTNYIAVDYNSGSPQYVVGTSNTANGHNIFNIGKVYRSGTNVDIVNAGLRIYDIMKRIQQKDKEESEFDFVSGGVVSETGTRNIGITSGVIYAGLNRNITDAIDTSATDTFTYYYYNGATWVDSSETQIDNTQYNDISSGLVTLNNNQYGVHWVYKGFGANSYVVYGRGSYTLVEATSAQPPVSLPDHVSGFSVLRAKIIIEKNGTAFTEIENINDIKFSSTSPSNHNELSGLQGGTAGEYYHLTSAQSGYIDQDVTSGSSPTFDGTNITGVPDGGLSESYVKTDGSRALTANWAAGSYEISVDTLSTSNATANMSLNDDTITAGGTNTDVDINLKPKGAGTNILENSLIVKDASSNTQFFIDVPNTSIIVGDDSGLSVLGATGFVLVGVEAGNALTSGSNNCLVGYQAGAALTDQDDITAIGYQALAQAVSLNNLGVGAYAGYNITSGDGENLAVGYKALYGSSASKLTGKRNIGVGPEAGMNISTGLYNSFYGWRAGYNLTTGARNFGMGAQALQGLISQSDNVAVGHAACASMRTTRSVLIGSYCGALSTATSGVEDNVGIGYIALQTITGIQNVAIGGQSLKVATATNNTTAIGFATLRTMTGTANGNTFIGAFSGENLDTASHCIAIGYNSMRGNSSSAFSGDYNIGIGEESADSLITGANSVMIGYRAGKYNETGSNNVLIGHECQDDNNTSLSDNVIIGSGACVHTESSGGCDGNVLIGKDVTGTLNNDSNVVIGATAELGEGADDCVVIGYDASSTGSNSIVLGHSTACTTSNQVLIGNSSHTSFVAKGFATGGTLTNVAYDTSTGELKSVDKSFQTITFSTSIALDFSDGPNQHVVLTDDFSLAAPSNLEDGATYKLLLEQDVGGSNYMTSANSAFQFEDGSTGDVGIAVAGGALTLITMVCKGSNLYCYAHGSFSTFVPPS